MITAIARSVFVRTYDNF